MSSPEPRPEAVSTPGATQPSLVPGVVMLGVAAVLIVVVILKPDMPTWLKIVISGLAVIVVLALLVYAFRVFRDNSRRGPV